MSQVKCPNCSYVFEPNEVEREQMKRELNEQMKDWLQKKEESFKQKEIALAKQQELKAEEDQKNFEEEKKKIAEQTAQTVRKNLMNDHEQQLKLMEENMNETRDKLEQSRKKEVEFLKKEQELLDKEKEFELKLQQNLLQERAKLEEQIKLQEAERSKLKEQQHEMEKNELKKQMDDQKKLIEEMKRKSEQGSMQLQGEVQELALEAILRNAFPFDVVNEVGKGKRGADCILTVRNSYGQECGSIIFESKRTKDFGSDWIEKLKADARNNGADVALIVTAAMPKDMNTFGLKDGVWICSFTEIQPVVSILREGILKVYNANKNNENKGDKMHMLYDYLTSHEFSEQWKAIREGFLSMKLSIQRERDAMEKLWKAREKQLEKVLLNAAHIKGSIEGISGMEQVDLNLGEADDKLFLE